MAKRVLEALLQTIAAAIYSKQGRFGFLILAPQVLFNDFAVNQLGNTITQSVVFVLNGFCWTSNQEYNEHFKYRIVRKQMALRTPLSLKNFRNTNNKNITNQIN